MAKGLFKEATKNTAGFWSATIENTGLGSKFFGTGKFPPKAAAGTWVEFDYTEKEVNGKTYYNVEGKLKEIEAPAGNAAPKTTSTSNGASASTYDPRQNSIESQVLIKCAVELAIADSSGLAAVDKYYQTLQRILHPTPVPPKTAPKKAASVEQEESEELPY